MHKMSKKAGLSNEEACLAIPQGHENKTKLGIHPVFSHKKKEFNYPKGMAL